jgi:hypothetical protein
MVRIFVSLEIRGTFGNEKNKEHEARQISAVEWTKLLLRILECLEFSPRPGIKLSVGRLFTGF